MLLRTVLIGISVAFAFALVGCGTDPAISQARTTLVSASRIVTDIDARASDGPAAFGSEVAARSAEPGQQTHWAALQRALRDAAGRLEQASEALDIWEAGDSDGGAWTTITPCLAHALAEIRAHLEALGVQASMQLDVALAQASSNGEHCASRRPPAEP